MKKMAVKEGVEVIAVTGGMSKASMRSRNSASAAQANLIMIAISKRESTTHSAESERRSV